MNETKVTLLHRFAPAFEMAIALGIPAIVLVVGYFSEAKKLNLEYVRMSVGILQQESPDQPQRELRLWAVGVLQKFAPYPLSGEQATSLAEGTTSLPKFDYQDYEYTWKPSTPPSTERTESPPVVRPGP